jgi:xylulokinase
MRYVLGIDVGTSGVKIIILNSEGKIIGASSARYEPDTPKDRYVEQDPAVWWDGTKEAFESLKKLFPEELANVEALACSGQMHSSVFLDENNAVIRPAILWNDTRTTKQTEDITAACGGEANLLGMAQNRALEGFTLPKILWLRENEPDNFQKTRKVIMPKDYVNFMLTGNVKTDVSDASGTLLFDVQNREWSNGMFKAVGLDRGIVPEAVESSDVVGVVRDDVAKELGLPLGVKVMAGGADNSCAAIGNGVAEPGQAVISVGTSGTVVAFLEGVTAEVTGEVHIFGYSYPQSDYAMGCMLSAGQCVNWFKKELLQGNSYGELNRLAETSPAGSNGVIFLPYLYGERCPYSDSYAKGLFFGLSGNTALSDLTRAVMEGVAFGLKDMFLLVEKFTSIETAYLTGGGAKSDVWTHIIADIIGRPVTLLNVEEGPALGAAIIAGVGLGVFADFKHAKSLCNSVNKVINPAPENSDVYAKRHEVFKKLYASLKDVYKFAAD